MSRFDAGDVVRVPFPYTDRSTRQRRPALVVSAGGIGEANALIWVVMITSADNRPWPDDIPLGKSFSNAGLPAPSVIRPCKLATIDARYAEPLGKIGSDLMTQVADSFRRYLGL